jgi:hypothetical protein
MKKQQTYANHSRIVASYHLVTFLAILAVLIGSFINLYNSTHENIYSASLICVISLILISLFFHARIFGLKAQDRAIRAEENFRHFVLTGKTMDSRIKLSQLIALRFASDEEFPTLAAKAASENLSNKQIKQLIKNWRGDYHRV